VFLNFDWLKKLIKISKFLKKGLLVEKEFIRIFFANINTITLKLEKVNIFIIG